MNASKKAEDTIAAYIRKGERQAYELGNRRHAEQGHLGCLLALRLLRTRRGCER